MSESESNTSANLENTRKKKGFWFHFPLKDRRNLSHPYKLMKNALSAPIGADNAYNIDEYKKTSLEEHKKKIKRILNEKKIQNELSVKDTFVKCYYCLKTVFQIEKHMKVKIFHFIYLIK